MPLTLAELTGIAAHLKTAFGPTTTHVLIATRSPIGHELGDEESYPTACIRQELAKLLTGETLAPVHPCLASQRARLGAQKRAFVFVFYAGGPGPQKWREG